MLRLSSHLVYFAVVVLLLVSVPARELGEYNATTKTIFVIGFLGMWRYSWAVLNFSRAALYRFVVYPTRKVRALARYEKRVVDTHAYFMVTTYMVEIETTMIVYRALFRAAARANGGATILASVVDGADERLIRTIYDNFHEDLSSVNLVIDRIASKGKRDAMARALTILGTFMPTKNDIMVFLDGDTIPPEDIVEQSAPFFTNPNIGALTTNEAALIDKKGLYRDWFSLRFRQRQVMMCSMGLASHVLTLTGRLSVFRADLATNEGFVEAVAHDTLDHWRLGRINFLTGDDKSTWFWLLRHGFQMLYLPDVQSKSYETQPSDSFYDSAKTLMIRWYGNMLRTNGRALKLSPKLIGGFTWWSILDQRISMWTTLVGPISVVITALFYDPAIIPLYLAWVMVTRYVVVVYITLFNGAPWFPVSHPLILYFSQVVGATVKTFVMFRLDRQRWTRQGSAKAAEKGTLSERWKAHESKLHHILGLVWLTLAIITLNSVT